MNMNMDVHTHRCRCTHRYKHTDPGEDGEEAESDGGSGGVGALGQWQLVWRGRLPLIGQKTEANEPQETGKAWGRGGGGGEGLLGL